MKGNQRLISSKSLLFKRLMLVICVLLGTAVCVSADQLSVQAYNSKLPVIYIDTADGQKITTKTEYKQATMRTQGNAQYNNEKQLYNGDIKIKGRGNTSWNLSYTKLPYHIKLDSKTNLLGLGKSKHWILAANYLDSSNLRNWIAYAYSNTLSIANLKSTFVDVVLNGKYAGLYLLVGNIRAESSRVDIFDWEEAADDIAKNYAKKNNLNSDQEDSLKDYMSENLSWVTTQSVSYNGHSFKVTDYLEDFPLNPDGTTNITGGYIFEHDHRYDEISQFKSAHSINVMFHSPEYANTNSSMFSYVQDFISNLEGLMYSNDFNGTYNGKPASYSDIFDVKAFAEYNMVNEILMENNACSTFFYKDTNGKIEFGPVWDYDKACVSTSGWFSNSRGISWTSRVIADPYYVTKFYECWQKSKGYFDDLIKSGGLLDQQIAYISESGAANYNGGFLNTKTAFASAASTQKTFMTNRINYMKQYFSSPQTIGAAMGALTVNNNISVQAEQSSPKELTFTASTGNGNAKKIGFYINSKLYAKIDTVNGKASCKLSDPDWLDETGSLNCVTVRGMNASGALLNSGALMNFAVFTNNGIGSYDITMSEEQLIVDKGSSFSLPCKVEFAGKEITDEATLKDISVKVENIGGFDKVKGLSVISENGTFKFKASNSGVAKVTLSYEDTSASTVVIVPGDANKDGKVSALDASMLTKYIRKTKEVSGDYTKALADMDKDGKITKDDLALMLKQIGK